MRDDDAAISMLSVCRTASHALGPAGESRSSLCTCANSCSARCCFLSFSSFFVPAAPFIFKEQIVAKKFMVADVGKQPVFGLDC